MGLDGPTWLQLHKCEDVLKKMNMPDIDVEPEGSNSALPPSSLNLLLEAVLSRAERQTLLEKVNEIFMSCVKLKEVKSISEDKGISEEKLKRANEIIENVEEKYANMPDLNISILGDKISLKIRNQIHSFARPQYQFYSRP